MRRHSGMFKQRLFKTPVLEDPRAVREDLDPGADFADLGGDFE